MKVLKNKRKGNTVSLEIEASNDSINQALDRAFKKVVKQAKLPGFRIGKVPRDIFEKNYGTDMIVQEGLSDVVNVSYAKAIEELDLEVVDFPKNINVGEYKENDVVSFTCEVDVRPEVKLGKYKGIKADKLSENASDDQLNDHIKQLQESVADFAEADRGAAKDDIVRVHINATIEGAVHEAWSRKNMGVKLGLANFGEDFDKAVEGLKKTETKQFTVTYSDDFTQKDVTGKTVDFDIEIVEVREKKLPELTDDFAIKVSQNQFKTYDALKADFTEKMNTEQKRQSEDKLKSDIIEQVVKNATMDIPEAMIEREMENEKKQYEQSLKQSGADIKQYLAMTGQSEDDFNAQVKDVSTKRIQSELALEAVAVEEKVEATDKDIKEEIQKLVPDAKTDEEIAKYVERVNNTGFRQMIVNRKTLDFLLDNAKITKK